MVIWILYKSAVDYNINVQTCFARERGQLGDYHTLWKVGMDHGTWLGWNHTADWGEDLLEQMTSKVRQGGAAMGTHIMRDLGSWLLFPWPRRGSQSVLHILWSCYIGRWLGKAWVHVLWLAWWPLEEPKRIWGLLVVCGSNLCPPSFQMHSLEVQLNEWNKMHICLISLAFTFVSRCLFCQHVFLGGLFFCFVLFFYFIHFLYLFLAVLGLHCCMCFSLVVRVGAVLCGLLIAVASPVAEHGL